MGGTGKTTIARAMFSQLSPMFDSVYFMDHIRELSKNSQPSILAALRHKLLSELLKDENLKFNHVVSTSTRTRLNEKKVFIVLDDVDSVDQLDVLCTVCDYVAPQSKLIITTRNKRLIEGRVDEIYKVKIWDFDASLELFCLHAFEQRFPQKAYKALSKAAVHDAGGVPLALRVLGNNLHSKSVKFWQGELKKIKRYSDDKIEGVLRVSYDGLDIPQKKLFLDIAFFFLDENKDFTERILNACDFFATSGLEVLEDKALITISSNNRIQMHDLLQEMGLNIVRHSFEDPGRRSRLRDVQDVYDVLQNKKGSDAVEGITLDLSQLDGLLSLSADVFNLMTKLRFLKLYIPLEKRSDLLSLSIGGFNIMKKFNFFALEKRSVMMDYPRVLNKISDKLRYLEWHGCRLNSLPTTFSAKMLVEIHMQYSHVTELWYGVKDVVNLERIDLSESKQLKSLPDLSKASKLKWVNLTGCESLLVVHPSVLSLNTLETLIVDSCKKLKNLKREDPLRSLKNISVNGCTSLKEYGVSSNLIENLDLSKTGIQILNSSIKNLTRLHSLNLESLSLKNLPNELSYLKSLSDLKICNCALVLDKQKLHDIFQGLEHLKILYLKDCPKMSELPNNISGLSYLYELRLDGSNVESLPESIKNLDNLEILTLNNCRKLHCLPMLPLHVRVLSAANCRSLTTLDTLKTFARRMRGKEKFISFQDCLKLHSNSLNCIMEGTQLTMNRALLLNKYDDNFGLKADSYNYNLVNVCLPGKRVLRQFKHQTTNSSLTIALRGAKELLGIILCAVLSPSEELMTQDARIWCQCYLEDGITKLGNPSSWYHKATTKLDSGHVYIWCDSFHFDSISKGCGQKVSFKFYVTNDMEKPELNICIKECGVHLVFDEKECNGIKNEAWVSRTKRSPSFDYSFTTIMLVCFIILGILVQLGIVVQLGIMVEHLY
ncbi:PREDICTED: disease resistance protein TAO1-like [Lupinus angustifolius]|nr:PREDICTED: disease resistance protein TAO1-like [Lupinus angustifolius]